VAGRDVAREVARIQAYWRMLRERNPERTARDGRRLADLIAQHE
jgi:hypothetical protein